MVAPTVAKTSRRRKPGKASAVSPLHGQGEGERASLEVQGQLERVPAGPSILDFEIVTPPQQNRLPSLANRQKEEDRCTAESAHTGISLEQVEYNCAEYHYCHCRLHNLRSAEEDIIRYNPKSEKIGTVR